jgi:hypothetical protein
MRGIPGGKIRPWDGWLISIRVEFGQAGHTSGAFVICNRSPLRWTATTGLGLRVHLTGLQRAQHAKDTPGETP